MCIKNAYEEELHVVAVMAIFRIHLIARNVVLNHTIVSAWQRKRLLIVVANFSEVKSKTNKIKIDDYPMMEEGCVVSQKRTDKKRREMEMQRWKRNTMTSVINTILLQ